MDFSATAKLNHTQRKVTDLAPHIIFIKLIHSFCVFCYFSPSIFLSNSSQIKRKPAHQTSTKKVFVQAAYNGSIQYTNKPDDDIEEEYEIINGRYQCGKCDKSLVDRQTFRLHFRLHTGKNLKRCPICGTGFAKNNHLDRHVALHYGSTFKCDICEEIFEEFKNFRLHSANHSAQ